MRLVTSELSGTNRRVTRWLCLLAFVYLSACNSVDPVIKVGLIGPFEGRHREIGYDVIYSARLAIREINAEGGVGGYRVALVALDDGGDPQLAEAAATSLIADPSVVAVVGHWLPETSVVATPLYRRTGLAHLEAGDAPFGRRDPETLPADFRRDYEAITPFDEVPGPYAGSAYEAFQTLWLALHETVSKNGRIDREGVLENLADLEGVR